MEGWQRAFVLHSRPWSEASLVLNVFAEESDRVRLVAKGARSKRSSLEGIFQPFTPLLLRLGGRGEVKTSRSVESVSLTLPLSRIMLYSDLYINELISRVFEYETRFSALFFDYLNYVQALADATDSPEPALCRFELALLGHLGYGVDFTRCADNGESVNGTMTYRYQEKEGFITSIVVDGATFTGRHLKALESWEFPDAGTLRAAKRSTRMTLKPYLSGKPLKDRELFRQFMPKRK